MKENRVSTPMKLYYAREKYRHQTPGFYEREAKREKKRARREKRLLKQQREGCA